MSAVISGATCCTGGIAARWGGDYIGWSEMDRQLVATPTMRHGGSTAVIHLTGNKAEHFGERGAGSVSYLRCVETPVGGFVRLPATDL